LFGDLKLNKFKKNLQLIFVLLIFFSGTQFLIMEYTISSNNWFCGSNLNSKNNPREKNLSIAKSVMEAPSSPSITYDSENNLFLIYKESVGNYSKIALLKTERPNIWNLTKEIIVEPENDTIINCYPQIRNLLNDTYIIYTTVSPYKSELVILQLDTTMKLWNSFHQMINETIVFSNPLISAFNDTLWVSWLSYNEEEVSLYYSKFNQTTKKWLEGSLVSDLNGYNSQFSDLFIDNNGTGHFVWSEGEPNYKKVLYREIFANDSKSEIKNITDGSSNCIHPKVYVDGFNNTLIFWSNYTEISPEMLGTINIHYSKKVNDSYWSKPRLFAPYLPPDREGMLADSKKPFLASCQNNILYVAYEDHQPYPYFMGVALRGIYNNNLFDGEPISLTITPCFDPQIVCDENNFVHCVWADFRISYYEIYYRVKFTNNTWSFEKQLTFYSSPAYVNIAGIYVGIILGTLFCFGVIPVSIYYILKKRQYKKIMQKRREEIQDI